MAYSSTGLGRCPFKAEKGVQLPYRLPIIALLSLMVEVRFCKASVSVRFIQGAPYFSYLVRFRMTCLR